MPLGEECIACRQNSICYTGARKKFPSDILGCSVAVKLWCYRVMRAAHYEKETADTVALQGIKANLKSKRKSIGRQRDNPRSKGMAERI